MAEFRLSKKLIDRLRELTSGKTLDLVQKLDLSDQMKLIDQLTYLVRQRMTTHPGHSILELQGPGQGDLAGY